MEEKENQRVMLTKRLLRENLLRLMTEKNIQKISVSELCKAAGINRTTFYNHYGSQYDILKEIETTMIDEIEQIFKREDPLYQWSLEKRVCTICTYLKEHQEIAKMLFENNSVDSEFVTKLFRVQQVWQAEHMNFPLRYDEVTKELLMTFLVSGTYQLIRQWLMDDVAKSPQEIGSLACDLATKGWAHNDESS